MVHVLWPEDMEEWMVVWFLSYFPPDTRGRPRQELPPAELLHRSVRNRQRNSRRRAFQSLLPGGDDEEVMANAGPLPVGPAGPLYPAWVLALARSCVFITGRMRPCGHQPGRPVLGCTYCHASGRCAGQSWRAAPTSVAHRLSCGHAVDNLTEGCPTCLRRLLEADRAAAIAWHLRDALQMAACCRGQAGDSVAGRTGVVMARHAALWARAEGIVRPGGPAPFPQHGGAATPPPPPPPPMPQAPPVVVVVELPPQPLALGDGQLALEDVPPQAQGGDVAPAPEPEPAGDRESPCSVPPGAAASSAAGPSGGAGTYDVAGLAGALPQPGDVKEEAAPSPTSAADQPASLPATPSSLPPTSPGERVEDPDFGGSPKPDAGGAAQ